MEGAGVVDGVVDAPGGGVVFGFDVAGVCVAISLVGELVAALGRCADHRECGLGEGVVTHASAFRAGSGPCHPSRSAGGRCAVERRM